MAANSKHYGDVREWLYKVIDSCTTLQQALSAKRLVRLYTEQYPYKEWGDAMYIDHECLLEWCDVKFTEIGNKLYPKNENI